MKSDKHSIARQQRVDRDLIGAAINDGVPLKVSSPVYQVMNGGAFPPDLEPRKRALTLENLLTMSSGLDCDDEDDNSPGREDFMVDESGATDYYKYTMALKMIREPGEKAVYCKRESKFKAACLTRAAGRLCRNHDDLVAGASDQTVLHGLTRGHLNGRRRAIPARDFLKLAPLYVNGGRGNGRKSDAGMVSSCTRLYTNFLKHRKPGTAICGGCTTILTRVEQCTPTSPVATVGSMRSGFQNLTW